MAIELNLHPISLPASGDLSASQFHIVDLDTNGNLVVVSATGGKFVGVLQDKPNALGQTGEVGLPTMVSKIVAGAAVNAGAQVMSDTTGRAITATTTSGFTVVGRALEAASAAGAIISVLLAPMYLA